MSRAAHASLSRLEEVATSGQILSDAKSLADRQVDQMSPSVVVQPTESDQIAEIVRFAATEKLAMIVSSGCTKLGIGAPPERYDIALDLSRMNRVLACDPADLTLGAEPGVRIETLLETLRPHRQFLPLAVPFASRATVGGVVASNSNSPLRHFYGGVRDFCLGMEFVTGDGVLSKSGGRVVKNVTGYDLHKPLIGSLGTLAVITRVNFRLFPILPVHLAFVASFSGAKAAFQFCREIGRSPLTPQVAEVVNPSAADLLSATATGIQPGCKQWFTIISAAGHAPVVDRYANELSELAAKVGATGLTALESSETVALLAKVSDFPQLVTRASPSAVIFRISVLPAAMPALHSQLERVASQNELGIATLTRASGFLYAALLPLEGGKPFSGLSKAANEIFHACISPEIGARAMIEWAPTEVKRAISVWGPARPDFALMQRLKNVFDPQRVLSPGRFAGGI